MNDRSRNPERLRCLSVVVPARDEAGSIPATVQHLHIELTLHHVPHEIVVVDDGSRDDTWQVLQSLRLTIPELVAVQNSGQHGFGRAIACGLGHISGDAVVIMMADESDDCRDVVRYWQHLNEGWDCVFGSRFVSGGGVIDYPRLKLLMNRLVNHAIRILFGIQYNDTTNAFKAYRASVITGCRPFLAQHFNLTVEIPLKAIVRGYTWVVIPITWRNRRSGEAKLKLKEMGSRYLFIILYVWLEKYLSRGDYVRSDIVTDSGASSAPTTNLVPAGCSASEDQRSAPIGESGGGPQGRSPGASEVSTHGRT